MSKRAKKEPIKHEEGWHCINCNVDILLIDDRKPIIEHMLTAHGIDATKIHASKQLVMAMDGAGWYENTNEWTWQPEADEKSCVRLRQTRRGPRAIPPRPRFVQMLERLDERGQIQREEIQDLSLRRLSEQVNAAKAAGWIAAKQIDMRRSAEGFYE